MIRIDKVYLGALPNVFEKQNGYLNILIAQSKMNEDQLKANGMCLRVLC